MYQDVSLHSEVKRWDKPFKFTLLFLLTFRIGAGIWKCVSKNWTYNLYIYNRNEKWEMTCFQGKKSKGGGGGSVHDYVF